MRLPTAVCACVLMLVSSGLAKDNDASRLPPWTKANNLYASAMSQYRARHYDQAHGLLEEFIKLYPSHEATPTAYLKLGYCKLAPKENKDVEGYEKAMEQVVRRFNESPAWFLAYGSMLSRRKKLEKNDEYLDLLEQMVRRCRQVPLLLGNDIHGHKHEWSWYRVYRWLRYPLYQSWMPRVVYPVSWAMDIAKIAEKPERADRALKALSFTLKQKGEDLPPDWQFAHVLLLAQAGKTDEADKAFAEYADVWGDDPRGMWIWLLKADHAREQKDDKTADECYRKLIEKYGRCHSLEAFLGARMAYLKQQKRTEDAAQLADYYLKTYPGGRSRGSAMRILVDTGRQKVLAGQASGIDPWIKMVERFYGKDSWTTLVKKIDLYVDLKQFEKAGQLAEGMLDPKHWSSGVFGVIRSYTTRNEVFKDLEKKAREKYGIPPEDPKSEAAELLKQLKGRIKDDQLRHMEEIAERMTGDYPGDAFTIEAVKLMTEYYFQKVMPEPRDKWMDHMVRTYPLHPLTEGVLRKRIQADRAARKYDRLAGAIDMLKDRFPRGGTYFNDRVTCYGAAKDAAGRLAYVRKYYAPIIKAGDTRSLERLAGYEAPPRKHWKETDYRAIGDYWMQKASKYAGTRIELFSLGKAFDAYFSRVNRYRYVADGPRACYDRAIEVVRRLQQQKIDPEISWAFAFRDVDVIAGKGNVKEAISVLEKRLRDVPGQRDVRLRVNLHLLGEILGRAKFEKEATDLAENLRKACSTQADADAIESMLAAMYGYAGKYVLAARHRLIIVNRSPWPAKAYGHFLGAARNLARAGSRKYASTVDHYIRKIENAQDLVPRLLYDAGLYYMQRRNRSAFFRARGILAKKYPASGARGKLEARRAAAIRK